MGGEVEGGCGLNARARVIPEVSALCGRRVLGVAACGGRALVAIAIEPRVSRVSTLRASIADAGRFSNTPRIAVAQAAIGDNGAIGENPCARLNAIA